MKAGTRLVTKCSAAQADFKLIMEKLLRLMKRPEPTGKYSVLKFINL